MEGDRKICYRRIPQECDHAGTAAACECVCWTGYERLVRFREGTADKTGIN